MKRKKYNLKTRLRGFRIWQFIGYNPWKSEQKEKEVVAEDNVKGFYRGAFDSIPFLNDDAKRTFVHLLLRPGYMIRDYIKGKHDIYLAPLTSLFIFYAFFSLISSIAHPDFRQKDDIGDTALSDSVYFPQKSYGFHSDLDITVDNENNEQINAKIDNLLHFLEDAYILTRLDLYPEAVDSPRKASLAALESSLRSQGIFYFLGAFLLLWPAIRITLRKQDMGWAASATTAAYILCQFSFFMLFVLILSFGKNNEIGGFTMGVLLLIDYHQLFGIGYRRSLWLTVRTGINIMLLVMFLIILSGCALTVYMLV